MKKKTKKKQKKKIPDGTKVNLATLMTYWFCATDPNLRRRVANKKVGARALERIGIPKKYIRPEVVKAVRENKDLFMEFPKLPCPLPRCWRLTQKKFYTTVPIYYKWLS